MKNKLAYTIASATFILTPLITFAAAKTLSTLVYSIIGYFNQALVLLMGLAVIVFVWNVIKYFIMSTEDHKEAAPYVMWSVIGFFVILSFWGLVNILQNTFGLQNTLNRPGSWSEFSNLFPASGGGNGGGGIQGSYTAPSAGVQGSYTAPSAGVQGSYTAPSSTGNADVPSYLPTPTRDSFNANQGTSNNASGPVAPSNDPNAIFTDPNSNSNPDNHNSN